MRNDAGVRTVVVGGQPRLGPMQVMGGTRGALEYDVDSLDLDMYVAGELNSTVASILPADRNPEFNFNTVSFNLRDQIRNNSNTPLQFTYEAADCRIFYTPSTYNNYTALWQYAADAIWSTPTLCVSSEPSYSNSTARAILAGFDNEGALETRDFDEDIGGLTLGQRCDPDIDGACGELICVQSPVCRGTNLDSTAFQCQVPCGRLTNSCPTSFQRCVQRPQGTCDASSCNFCPYTKPLTRADCRATRTTHDRGVPNGPVNIPPGLVGRRAARNAKLG